MFENFAEVGEVEVECHKVIGGEETVVVGEEVIILGGEVVEEPTSELGPPVGGADE